MDNDAMLLTGSRRIADGKVQTVTLQPMVGAYQMICPSTCRSLRERVVPKSSIAGARILAKFSDGEPRPLGFARPKQPDIVGQPFVHTAHA